MRRLIARLLRRPQPETWVQVHAYIGPMLPGEWLHIWSRVR